MILLTDKKDSETITNFRKFAKENAGDYIFSFSSITGGFGAKLAEYIGIKPENDPAVRFISFEGG